MEREQLLSISARSKRQAMEWGLVLASQGIEAVIDNSGEGWGLLVEWKDFDRAQANLETIPPGEPGLAMAATHAGNRPVLSLGQCWDGSRPSWLFIIGARCAFLASRA
jgi:hypothetical protein